MKTWMKKLTALILIVLLVIGSVNLKVDVNGESGEGLRFSMTEANAKGKKVAPKKVTVEGSKYVAKGKKIKLKAVVAPEGANQKVIWTSSNPAVAKVDQKGNVKGIKPGKAKITAASKDNPKKKKAYAVKVMAQAVKKVIISGAPETMTVGTTVTLKAAPDPKKAAKSFEWKSSNTAIATVNVKGQVTAVAAGPVTITATATDGGKGKGTINIIVVGPEEPVTPTEPETPVAPTEPETPVTPIEPETPATPTEPETPVTPTDPDPQTQEKNDHTFEIKYDEGTYNEVTVYYAYYKASDTVTITNVTGALSGHFIIPARVKDKLDGKDVTVSGLNDGALEKCNLNYIEVEGTTTTLAGIDSVPFVLAPTGSQAATDAGSKYVQAPKKDNQFLYDVSGGSATVLCPLSTSHVTGNVAIPASVDGVKVEAIDKHALDGTSNVTGLSIPDNINTADVPDEVKEIVGTENIKSRTLVKSIIICEENGLVPSELVANQKITLIATVNQDAELKDVLWESSNEAIASIEPESGVVTAIKFGKVTFTATAKDGSLERKSTEEIQIWSLPTGITVNPKEVVFNEGDEAVELTATILPEGEVSNTLAPNWTIEGTAEVTLSEDNGKTTLVTPVTAGSATITATLDDDHKDTVNVTVCKVPASVTLKTGDSTMTVGETQTIECVVEPENEANQKVTYTSSNPGVATVDEKTGVVNAIGAGETIITIETTAPDVKTTLTLTVKPLPTEVKITNITGILSVNLYPNANNAELRFTATVGPDGVDDTVIWESSDENIATVNDGAVTVKPDGVAIGDKETVIITATSAKNASAHDSAEITIYNEQLLVDNNGKLTEIVIPADGRVVIPKQTMTGEEITAISGAPFVGDTALKELEILASITTIPEKLCEDCTTLTKVTLPNSIKTLGAYAFKGTALMELTIPGQVLAIPASLCEGCTNLTKVIMPNGITEIGQAAFKGCISLSSSETYDGAAE